MGQQCEFRRRHPYLPDGSAIVAAYCWMWWNRNEIKTLQQGMPGAKYLYKQAAWNEVLCWPYSRLNNNKVRQYTNNVTYYILWVCVCSLKYPAFNANAPQYIILPVVLYGCEIWSLTLREEHRLRVFENRVLRRIFGPRRDGVRGEWRKLHNEGLNDLYCSPNVVWVKK